MRTARCRLVIPTVVVLGVAWGLSGPARTAAPKPSAPAAKAAKPRWFGVRFRDESNIRVTLLTDKVSVTTAYGRLVVPAADIRRIEFGHRFPEGVQKRIHTAIDLLGTNVFAEREKASKELLELGPHSYQPLRRLLNGSDLELVRRSKALIAKLEAIYPREQLDRDADDRIHTDRFVIVGRIDSDTLEVKTPYFGQARVNLCEVLELRGQGTDPDRVLAIDAARYAGPALAWMDTGTTVRRGRSIKITATGQIDMYPLGTYVGQYMATPVGPRWAGGAAMQPLQRPGALLGRIGLHGPEFSIGDRYEGKPTEEGRLYLRIVTSPWNNASSGEYKVSLAQE